MVADAGFGATLFKIAPAAGSPPLLVEVHVADATKRRLGWVAILVVFGFRFT